MPENAKDESSKPIVEGNWPGLLAVVLLNIAVFAVVIRPDLEFGDTLKKLYLLLPAGVGLVMIRVVNGLVTEKWKHRLVYWSNTLPGCRAFESSMLNDPRINRSNLEAKYRPFPTGAHEQNALWYAIYQSLGEWPSLVQALRSSELTKDYLAISLLMVLLLGGSALWIAPKSAALLYLAGLVIQYLLVWVAARNYGIELVRNVLAKASSEQAPHSHSRAHHEPDGSAAISK